MLSHRYYIPCSLTPSVSLSHIPRLARAVRTPCRPLSARHSSPSSPTLHLTSTALLFAASLPALRLPLTRAPRATLPVGHAAIPNPSNIAGHAYSQRARVPRAPCAPSIPRHTREASGGQVEHIPVYFLCPPAILLMHLGCTKPVPTTSGWVDGYHLGSAFERPNLLQRWSSKVS